MGEGGRREKRRGQCEQVPFLMTSASFAEWKKKRKISEWGIKIGGGDHRSDGLKKGFFLGTA